LRDRHVEVIESWWISFKTPRHDIVMGSQRLTIRRVTSNHAGPQRAVETQHVQQPPPLWDSSPQDWEWEERMSYARMTTISGACRHLSDEAEGCGGSPVYWCRGVFRKRRRWSSSLHIVGQCHLADRCNVPSSYEGDTYEPYWRNHLSITARPILLSQEQ
jgi:hypothetical protein